MTNYTNALFIGKFYHYLEHVSSTNDYLLNVIKSQKVPEGTVIMAGHQTAGKGQRGNTWLDQANQNIAMSIYLKPHFLPLTRQFYLSMTIALSISQCIADLLEMQVFIKWPNDILVKDQKICGILIENMTGGKYLQESIIGIGLNVNQTTFPNSLKRASSLKLLTNKDFELLQVAQKLWVRLEQNYLLLRDGKYREIKEKYLNHLYLMNQYHIFYNSKGPLQGKIIGVDAWGHLVIEKTDGKQATFDVKEIAFWKE